MLFEAEPVEKPTSNLKENIRNRLNSNDFNAIQNKEIGNLMDVTEHSTENQPILKSNLDINDTSSHRKRYSYSIRAI